MRMDVLPINLNSILVHWETRLQVTKFTRLYQVGLDSGRGAVAVGGAGSERLVGAPYTIQTIVHTIDCHAE